MLDAWRLSVYANGVCVCTGMTVIERLCACVSVYVLDALVGGV